jgi:hypothetical protein
MAKKTAISIAALAIFGLASTAWADDMGTDTEADASLESSSTSTDTDVDVDANINTDTTARPELSSLDSNSDGKVTRTEAASDATLTAQFDDLDENDDGSLTEAEFAEFETKDGFLGTDDSTPTDEDELGPGR